MAAKSVRRPPKPLRSKKTARKNSATAAATKDRSSPQARKAAVAKPRDDGKFPIVGIGASAGGFESVMALLKNLPADTGMAFVIVQHLDPKHTSRLSELLVRATSMAVHEITDGMIVRPNCVHVIPPNYDLAFHGHTLRLIERPETERVHMSIDHFFESLATEHKERAIGVVLSGTGKDGTLGLAAIKEAGGITFAEAEKSARYFAMPGSAIAAGIVDMVLTPQELAVELPKIGRHPYLRPPAPAAQKRRVPAFPESADD